MDELFIDVVTELVPRTGKERVSFTLSSMLSKEKVEKQFSFSVFHKEIECPHH